MCACACVCEMDPRRHGRPPVIFQQLFPLRSCTAADRTLQITLILPTAACDSPEGSGARCCGGTQTGVEEHPTSITPDPVSAASAVALKIMPRGGFGDPCWRGRASQRFQWCPEEFRGRRADDPLLFSHLFFIKRRNRSDAAMKRQISPSSSCWGGTQ